MRRYIDWSKGHSSAGDFDFMGNNFGTVGMVSIVSSLSLATWLGMEKLLKHADLMTKHGPLMIFAAVLLLGGINMLAVGLLGEMQVRHYHEPARRAPYSVDRLLRAQSEESTISE